MVKGKKLQETTDYLDRQAVAVKEFTGEPFKCWRAAKELRMRVYKDFAEAHARGGLRMVGGSWSFGMPISAGLGDDVYFLASEPYSASAAFDKDFSLRCMEITESKGWASDLCAYMKNYLGSIYLDEYAFGGQWPKPDIIFQEHLCCAHAKWYQIVKELEGGEVPFWAIDVSVGPYEVGPGKEQLRQHRLRYVADQVLESMAELDEYAQRKWGRRFDDEKFIEAVHNDCNASSLWAEICRLNQAVPAPMDEKSMYTFFNLAAIDRQRREVTDFYKELRDEMEDRIARGVAASPNERFRVLNMSVPSWGNLAFLRYLEHRGCVSVGSFYAFALHGVWEEDDQGVLLPRKTPQQKGIQLRTREEAVEAMVDWYLSFLYWRQPYDFELFMDLISKVTSQWKCGGIIANYNRGCHLTTLGMTEARLMLLEKGVPVLAYEGNMADFREFDMTRIRTQADAFLESLGLGRGA